MLRVTVDDDYIPRSREARQEARKFKGVSLKKFKREPRYPHHRSEGLTRRTNGGSFLQPEWPNGHYLHWR